MKTKTQQSIEQIRQTVISTLPFVIDGKTPIEIRHFKNINELAASLKTDMKDKYAIKLSELIDTTIDKFNEEKWDKRELAELISRLIEDQYDLFGPTLTNKMFFDYDNFYKWDLLYKTFDELKVEFPYDEFVKEISLAAQDEFVENLELAKVVYNMLLIN